MLTSIRFIQTVRTIGNAVSQRAGTRIRRPRAYAASAMCVVAVVGGGWWAAGPLRSSADSRPDPSDDVLAAREEVADRLATAIENSVAVLAIRSDESAPGTDILLWLHDTWDQGDINRSEILLISFSRALGTISTYRASGFAGSISGHPVMPLPIGSDPSQNDPVLSLADLTSAAFMDQWRSRAVVQSHVIVRGVSDLLVQKHASGDLMETMIEIGLIWGSESADPEQNRLIPARWMAHQPEFSKEPHP